VVAGIATRCLSSFGHQFLISAKLGCCDSTSHKQCWLDNSTRALTGGGKELTAAYLRGNPGPIGSAAEMGHGYYYYDNDLVQHVNAS
jgi:hypothetical protein